MALAASLQKPFNCAPYGELCDVLDTNDAHKYACGVWSSLKAGKTVETIVSNANDYFGGQAGECSAPDVEDCNEACGDFDISVCARIRSPDGLCRTIITCTAGAGSLRDIFGFDGILDQIW